MRLGRSGQWRASSRPMREFLPETMMANNGNLIFNSKEFLKRVRTQKTTEDYQNQQPIFSQGDAADAMFCIQSGNVKLSVVSALRYTVLFGTQRCAILNRRPGFCPSNISPT